MLRLRPILLRIILIVREDAFAKSEALSYANEQFLPEALSFVWPVLSTRFQNVVMMAFQITKSPSSLYRFLYLGSPLQITLVGDCPHELLIFALTAIMMEWWDTVLLSFKPFLFLDPAALSQRKSTQCAHQSKSLFGKAQFDKFTEVSDELLY